MRDVLAADYVEDHVHAARCGVRLHLSDEILCAVINDHIRAECATELRLLVIADRGKHRGAMQLGELDGRVADAAGAAMDECRLAG